jgi:hypothetical protein
MEVWEKFIGLIFPGCSGNSSSKLHGIVLETFPNLSIISSQLEQFHEFISKNVGNVLWYFL